MTSVYARFFFLFLLFISIYIIRYQMTKPVWPSEPTPVVVTGVVEEVRERSLRVGRIPVFCTLGCPGSYHPRVQFGDWVRVEGVMQPDQPGGSGGVVTGATVTLLEREAGNPVVIAIRNLREAMIQRVRRVLPEPHAGLFVGVVFGAKTELPRQFQEQLRRTGTTHIVVASGMNVALLLAAVFVLLPLVGRNVAVGTGLSLIAFYTVLVGFDPPIVRAALMAGMGILGRFLGRPGQGFWVLGVTAGVMLLFDPQLVHSVSFQLSVAATAGILTLEEKIRAILNHGRATTGFFASLRITFIKDLSTTLAAQIAVTPILIYHFREISILSPLVNVLVLWTVLPIMVIGLVGVMLAPIPVVGEAVFWLTWPILHYFVMVIELFDRFPLTLVGFPE